MTLDELAQVVWVRALEESDPDCDFVRRRLRDRASQAARPAASSAAKADEGAGVGVADPRAGFVGRRASILLGELATERAPLAAGWRVATALPPAWSFVLVGLVAGVLAESLGGRYVNLLAAPLLGLLAWNLAFYAGEALRALGFGGSAAVAALGRGFSALALRLAAQASATASGRGSGMESAYQARVASAFATQWPRAAGAAAWRPLRARLHAAAAGFALGAIAGLYLRGFAFAFVATWESTFLDAAAAARFLGVLLAPAQLAGFEAPTTAMLAALEAPQHGPAAAWIHRWALALAAWVVAPRLLFAAGLARQHRRERGLLPPFEDAYFVRVLARRAGSERAVLLVPYAAEPEGRVNDRLRELTVELFGAAAGLRVDGVAEYGDDPPTLGEGPPPEAVLVVFPLAQTPEAEVHGHYLEELRRRLQALPAHPPLVVVLDEERYAQTAGPERCEQRRAAWQRVLREVNVEAVSIGGAEQLPDSALEAAARAVGRERAGVAPAGGKR